MSPAAKVATQKLSSRPTSQLTATVLGRPLSMAAALEFVESLPLETTEDPALRDSRVSIWVGSVGYEQHKSVDDFARLLADAGIELLIDVRELPVSRRRGFAKSALAAALAEHSVEYVHARSMGNPKPLRDLYKSGNVAAGRAGFEELLRKNRIDELQELSETVQEKRAALMCVEDDENICHRQVIFEALRNEVGLDLEISRLG